MQAHYLRADQCLYHRDYPNVMPDALIAYDASQEINDDYWRAKTAEQIADCFDASQNFSESIPYRNEAIEYYQRAGKERNVLFSLADKADALDFLGNRARSICILDSIYTISKQVSDTSLTVYCLDRLYHHYLVNNDIGKAYSLYMELESYDEFSPNASNYADLANMLLFQGRTDEANEAIHTSKIIANNTPDSLALLYSFIDHSFRTGNEPEYYAYSNSYIKLLNNYIRDTLKQPTVAAQREYIQNKASQERIQKEKTIRNFIFVISFLIIAIIATYCYLSNRIKRQNRELESKMAEMHNVKLQLSNENTVNKELKNEIEILYKDQWNTLNTLCSQYFEGPDNTINKTLVLSEFKSHLDKLSSSKNIRSLEASLNKYMDNIIHKLRLEIPSLTEQDVTLLVLHLAGFSPKTACIFMSLNLKTFYSKRSRLISKITDLNTPSQTLFIKKLT